MTKTTAKTLLSALAFMMMMAVNGQTFIKENRNIDFRGSNIYRKPVIVGDSAVHPSAIAEYVSNSKGILVPRMTAGQMAAIPSPATGLLIYNTSVGAFHYYNGSAWMMIGGGGSNVPSYPAGRIPYYTVGDTLTTSPGWHRTDTSYNLLLNKGDVDVICSYGYDSALLADYGVDYIPALSFVGLKRGNIKTGLEVFDFTGLEGFPEGPLSSVKLLAGYTIYGNPQAQFELFYADSSTFCNLFLGDLYSSKTLYMNSSPEEFAIRIGTESLYSIFKIDDISGVRIGSQEGNLYTLPNQPAPSSNYMMRTSNSEGGIVWDTVTNVYPVDERIYNAVIKLDSVGIASLGSGCYQLRPPLDTLTGYTPLSVQAQYTGTSYICGGCIFTVSFDAECNEGFGVFKADEGMIGYASRWTTFVPYEYNQAQSPFGNGLYLVMDGTTPTGGPGELIIYITYKIIKKQ